MEVGGDTAVSCDRQQAIHASRPDELNLMSRQSLLYCHLPVHLRQPHLSAFGQFQRALHCRVTTHPFVIGMYRRAIFKIWPEPDSTGYQTNYPAGTRYLDTCCIIANFLVYFVVRIKNVLFPVFVFSFVSTTNICKTVGLHDS